MLLNGINNDIIGIGLIIGVAVIWLFLLRYILRKETLWELVKNDPKKK